jgi:hypothetical protein
MSRRTLLALAVASVITRPLAVEAEPISSIVRNGSRNKDAIPFDTKYREWVSIKEFGAKGDGVTDDSQAIINFSNAFQGKSVAVVFPPGSYNWNYNNTPFGGLGAGAVNPNDPLSTFEAGSTINELWIFAYGATWVNSNPGLAGQVVGGFNRRALVSPAGDYIWSYINTVIQPDKGAQSSSVTCTTPSNASFFQPGDWINLAALDVQDADVNSYYYEYAQVVATDPTTGIVTLDRFLRNSYLSTYPTFPNSRGQHQAGAATIYKMDPSWTMKVHVFGLSVIGSCQFRVGSLECRDCNFNFEVVPAICYDWTFDNCIIDNTVEIDKDVVNLTYRDCYFSDSPLVQSPSPEFLTFENCTLSNGFQGTAKNTIIRNCTAPYLNMGSRTFGRSDTLLIENSKINKLSNWGNFPQNLLSHYTFSNGTFSRAISTGPDPGCPFWATEGGIMYFWDNGGTGYCPLPFMVTNIRTDGTNTLVDTTLGPNAVTNASNFAEALVAAPVRALTVRNCNGCDALVDLSNAPANSLYGTYSSRTLLYNSYLSYGTPLSMAKNGGGNSANLPLFGYFQSLTVNVIRPYTGIHAPPLHQWFWGLIKPDLSGNIGYVIKIDTTQAGTRTILPGSNTGLRGVDNVDVIPANAWIQFAEEPAIVNVDISAENFTVWPIVQYEIKTAHTLGLG